MAKFEFTNKKSGAKFVTDQTGHDKIAGKKDWLKKFTVRSVADNTPASGFIPAEVESLNTAKSPATPKKPN